MEPLRFRCIYGQWWDAVIPEDGKETIETGVLPTIRRTQVRATCLKRRRSVRNFYALIAKGSENTVTIMFCVSAVPIAGNNHRKLSLTLAKWRDSIIKPPDAVKHYFWSILRPVSDNLNRPSLRGKIRWSQSGIYGEPMTGIEGLLFGCQFHSRGVLSEQVCSLISAELRCP